MFAILRRCFQIESCFKRQTKIPMQVQSAVEGKNLQQKNEIRNKRKRAYRVCFLLFFYLFLGERAKKIFNPTVYI